MRRCKKCHQQMPDEALFCPFCQAKVKVSRKEKKRRKITKELFGVESVTLSKVTPPAPINDIHVKIPPKPQVEVTTVDSGHFDATSLPFKFEIELQPLYPEITVVQEKRRSKITITLDMDGHITENDLAVFRVVKKR